MEKPSTAEGSEADDLKQQQQRTERLRASLHLLQQVEPGLLQRLEKSRHDHQALALYVEGYAHTEELVLAILRCAHAFGVILTIVPNPLEVVSDISRDVSL